MLYKTEKYPSTVLRLFLTYGPGQSSNRFVPQIIKNCLTNKKFDTSSGKQIRDFCYIDDTVNGIIKSMISKKTNGEIFNLASGKPSTIRSVIKKVIKITGKGKPQWGKRFQSKSEKTDLCASIKKIKKILKWSPKVSLDKGLRATINSYK